MVWDQLMSPRQFGRFFCSEFRLWLCSHLCSNVDVEQLPWKIVFVFACWIIWKWRNDHVFNSIIELPFCPRKVIIATA